MSVITYRVDPDEAGAVGLEFYATHRRTNDRHVRITADGQGEYLEALRDFVILNSKQHDLTNRVPVMRRLRVRL